MTTPVSRFSQSISLEQVAARSRARRFLNVGSYNLLAWFVLAIYLLPVAFMLVTALKSTDQLSDPNAPWYPPEYPLLPTRARQMNFSGTHPAGSAGTGAGQAGDRFEPVHRPAQSCRRIDSLEWRLTASSLRSISPTWSGPTSPNCLRPAVPRMGGQYPPGGFDRRDWRARFFHPDCLWLFALSAAGRGFLFYVVIATFLSRKSHLYPHFFSSM